VTPWYFGIDQVPGARMIGDLRHYQ
jgi:hypothetical protein